MFSERDNKGVLMQGWNFSPPLRLFAITRKPYFPASRTTSPGWLGRTITPTSRGRRKLATPDDSFDFGSIHGDPIESILKEGLVVPCTLQEWYMKAARTPESKLRLEALGIQEGWPRPADLPFVVRGQVSGSFIYNKTRYLLGFQLATIANVNDNMYTWINKSTTATHLGQAWSI